MTPGAYSAALADAWACHLAPRADDAPTVVSLFAGGGGSSLGYSMAGYRELAACDLDAHACATLRANFPGVRVVEGDVSHLTTRAALAAAGVAAGELDVLDGSPPCQGFSTAGRRELGDKRSRLFEQFVRLLAGMRPRALVVENVSGLVKGKMRATFVEVLRALERAGDGYRVRARVLNAAHYGVPQHRERVIFVGVRADLGVEPSHPAPTTPRPITVREALDLHADPPDVDQVPPLSDRYGRLWPHVRQGDTAREVLGDPDLGFNNTKKLDPRRPAQTIPKMQSGRGYATVVHPLRPRALAVSEAMALSSIPPAFVIPGDSYQERWARVGNCVPPLLMRAVAEHVRAILGGAP